MGKSMFYIALILAIHVTLKTAATELNKDCKTQKELEQICGYYTHSIVQPLLDYIRKIKDEIKESNTKDIEIKALKDKLIEQASNVAINKVYTDQIEFQQTVISRLTAFSTLTEECDQYKKDIAEKDKLIAELNAKDKTDSDNLKKTQLELEESKKNYLKQEKELENCRLEVDKLNKTTENKNPNSCVPFGDSSGTHQIILPGLNSFDVLCDNKTAGPGWTIIEHRFNGGESFNRNWATFREGFGSFTGDFFLGLEKIHRLTYDQFHELYIHMERFDGRVDYARYDRFAISNEADKYRINVLGEFTGTVEDKFRTHAYMKFTTSDSDNDAWTGGSCAHYREAGWWYDNCVTSFLHGAYYNHATDSYSSIYFQYPSTIKTLKMMIRPVTQL